MYKPIFNIKRQVLVFRHFGNKGYSLFACLGREVVCSVLSVATLTYASAESVSTDPVVTDSASMTTAREMMLEEVCVTGSRAPLTKSQAARMVTVLERADIAQAPVQSINDLLKYAVGVDVRQRGPIGAQTDISIRGGTSEQIIILLNGINICAFQYSDHSRCLTFRQGRPRASYTDLLELHLACCCHGGGVCHDRMSRDTLCGGICQCGYREYTTYNLAPQTTEERVAFVSELSEHQDLALVECWFVHL